MNGMQDLYGQPYPAMDPSGSYPQDASINNLDAGAETLDQILSQNNEELMRRRSVYNPNQFNQHAHQNRGRRASLMAFGTTDLADFQFDPNPAPPELQQMPDIVSHSKALDPRRVRSKEDLALNTQFRQMNTSYDLSPNVTTYSPAMMGHSMAGEPNNYIPTAMDMSMDFDAMAGDATPMSVHPGMQQPLYSESPLSTGFPVPYAHPNHDPDGDVASPHTPINSTSAGQMPQNFSNKKTSLRRNPSAPMAPSPLSMVGGSAGHSVMPSPLHAQNPLSRRQSVEGQSPFTNNGIGDFSLNVPGTNLAQVVK